MITTVVILSVCSLTLVALSIVLAIAVDNNRESIRDLEYKIKQHQNENMLEQVALRSLIDENSSQIESICLGRLQERIEGLPSSNKDK